LPPTVTGCGRTKGCGADASNLRIDNRLIHGQATVAWIGAMGVDHLIVSDDEVAKDELRRLLLRLAARSVRTSSGQWADTLGYCARERDAGRLIMGRTPCFRMMPTDRRDDFPHLLARKTLTAGSCAAHVVLARGRERPGTISGGVDHQAGAAGNHLAAAEIAVRVGLPGPRRRTDSLFLRQCEQRGQHRDRRSGELPERPGWREDVVLVGRHPRRLGVAFTAQADHVDHIVVSAHADDGDDPTVLARRVEELVAVSEQFAQLTVDIHEHTSAESAQAFCTCIR
jgi:hypothetical protein